jgi:hypothetical protein
MPKALEQALKKEAKKKGFGEKRANAYVYGAMRAQGWKPGVHHTHPRNGRPSDENNVS